MHNLHGKNFAFEFATAWAKTVKVNVCNGIVVSNVPFVCVQLSIHEEVLHGDWSRGAT